MISRLLALFMVVASLGAAERPNFIIINCDDLGYNDIGPFGSKLHRTPNLDRFAKEGRRMTSHYSTSGVCSPSRSSLMTGCYPRRVGLHENEVGGWVLFPGNKKGLNPSEITIAEVLKPRGYATAIIGKWHLGDQPEFLPTRQGFDYYFGIPYSNDMGHDSRPKPYRYPPLPLLENEQVIEEEPDQRYLTQRYTEEAIKWIDRHKGDPFFLYWPHTMPHWPQYSGEAFDGKSKNGKWGDTVEEIDWSVGELMQALKEFGIDERTLVVFTSDNGGAVHHGASNFPLKGAKGSTDEGGQRVPLVVRWPGRVPAGTSSDELTTMMDFLPTFARLAGTREPTDRTIDGRDIWTLLSGTESARTPHEAFFYYFKGDLHAVRSGPWKLRVADRPARAPKGKPIPKAPRFPRLYHLGDDIGEAKDVAADHPDVVARLRELLALARRDLGDANQPGRGQRPPGMREDARPLTRNL